MATHYLYGTVLTDEGVAANNRGDNLGNTTTLQKVFLKDDLHTTVSAESIRFALRYRFQLEHPAEVNRKYDRASGTVEYKDRARKKYWKPADCKVLIDDDLMGFMDATKAKEEKEAESVKGAKIWASPLAIGRAVSLRPYRGELSFNCVAGKEAKVKGQLSLYNAEMHCTEYQYSFGLNLNDVINKANIGHLIDAIVDPPAVAGNHARFAYDFSPASIILRVTSAHASRIQNCFEHDEASRSYTIDRLISRVKSGDVPASGLIIGGEVAATAQGKELQKLGVKVCAGVKEAADEARHQIAALDEKFKVVANNGASKQ